MPWVSDKQRRWGHTSAGIEALGGKAKVAEWDKASKGKHVPLRLHPKMGTQMSKHKSYSH